jgi:hypothetical protein
MFTLRDRKRLGWARVSLAAKFRLTSADAAVPRPGHRYPGLPRLVASIRPSIDGVTLSDGEGRGERAQCRRSVLEQFLRSVGLEAHRMAYMGAA